ncbi:MAG: hypothetical protein KY459_05000 [Acidobacteria bacterium]|nr:hypothetical protein [Acidobacteriota bacterium]
MSDREHERAHIELAIERARDRVGTSIDELDERVKSKIDFGRMAREHTPQLLAVGGVIGLVMGLGIPKAFIRMVQIGIPVGIALEIARRSRPSDENQEQAESEAKIFS